jgi:hypothetical protein
MKLLDDIIESVTITKEPVADILRRCLVLAFKLKNDTLKKWVEKELNGYDRNDPELPEYRKSAGVSKGILIGPFQQYNDQPLSPHILEPKHRHFANEIRFNQPIASYEREDMSENAMLPWPSELVVYYQHKFIEDMVLNRAWMEIPGSLMTGLVDTVRTRILTFVLEIQAQLPENTEKAVEQIPAKTVDRIIQLAIYGGNVVIGNVEAFHAPTVVAGDANTLMSSLKGMGVSADDLKLLEASLKKDQAYTVDGVPPKIEGKNTKKWIAATAKKLGGGAAKIGGAVVEEAIKAAVMRYLGLSL